MKFQKKPGLSSRDIQLLSLIAIVTVAVLGTLIGADIRLSASISGGGGFFAPWEAARGFLFRNVPPYGRSVVSAAQQLVYGRLAEAGENPYIPAVPFFLLPVYFPLAWISDPATARGIWMFLEQAALVATVFVTLRLIEWQSHRAFQIGFALLSVFSLYSVMALLEGGPATLLSLLYMSVLLAFSTEQDELAGGLLVLTLFAWEIGLLLVIFLLWKTVYDKRWRVLAGFGMAAALLLVVSLLVYPGWILPYATASLAMLRASSGTTTHEILARLLPQYGTRAGQFATVVLVLLVLYEWAATRTGDTRRFVWAACLTLAITPLIGVRTDVPNLVVLLPGLALVCAAVSNRWRAGYWLAALLLLFVFLLPWASFLRWNWFNDDRFRDYLILFLPVFMIMGLYWTRWWFVRPPRTWLEHVHGSLSKTQPLLNSKRRSNISG